MSPIHVRRAERTDLPELGRLGAMLMTTHHEFDAPRFMEATAANREGYAAFLAHEIADDAVAMFVAERDGEIVGYAYAGTEERSWKELRETAGFVHDLVVVPSARRQGVGEALLEAAAAWLGERGVARVLLWTAEHNTIGQRLFAKLGFRRTMIEMTREVDRG